MLAAGALGGLSLAEASKDTPVEAIKKRLRSKMKLVAEAAAERGLDAAAAGSADGLTAVQTDSAAALPAVALIQRPGALAGLSLVTTCPGSYVLSGSKGDGKTTLVLQLAQNHPCVIYVDLQQASVHQAVKAVARALGCELAQSATERAAAAAASAPKEEAKPKCEAKSAAQAAAAVEAEAAAARRLYGVADFRELLSAFEQACKELRAEGATGGHLPVLILE